jgi:hypothetical protein
MHAGRRHSACRDAALHVRVTLRIAPAHGHKQRARAPGTAAQVAQSLGLLIGATVMDAKMAQTVVAVVMLTMMLARPEALLGI